MGNLKAQQHRENIAKAVSNYWQSHLTQRVIANLDKVSSPHGCWLWGGAKDTKGYGRLKVGGKVVKAHRVVYQLVTGEELTEWDLLLHSCPGGDNPSCCNPAHLRKGTLQQNVRDAVERGQVRQGSHHPNATLTEAQVIEMRALHETGESIAEIARAYNHRKGNVALIVNGKAWKHVPGVGPPARGGSYLTEEAARRAIEMLAGGCMCKDVARELQVSNTSIWFLQSGKTWKYLPRPEGMPQPRFAPYRRRKTS